MSENINAKLNEIHDILHRFDVPESRLKEQSRDLAALDLNIQDENGFTALMTEVIKNNIDAVELLLTHGIDTEIELSGGETALMLAIEEGHPLLVEAVAMYADINYSNRHGDNALGIAKYYDVKDIINIIEKYGGIDTGKTTFIEEIENGCI